mgnify:CR=1 FL=1
MQAGFGLRQSKSYVPGDGVYKPLHIDFYAQDFVCSVCKDKLCFILVKFRVGPGFFIRSLVCAVAADQYPVDSVLHEDVESGGQVAQHAVQ